MIIDHKNPELARRQIRAIMLERGAQKISQITCTHKYHQKSRTPEECIALQKKHAKQSLENEITGFLEIKDNIWRNRQQTGKRYITYLIDGIVPRVQLVGTPDEFTCPTCTKLAGQYFTAGDVRLLAELMSHYGCKLRLVAAA